MTDKPIPYQPTDGLCYDPEDPRYWDPMSLQKEIDRVFEVCNGCRMCFKYCDSFPSLFKLLDDEVHLGDVTALTAPEVRSVMDQCFQCKLCEVQCPYTPRDKHEYQLDFPKLVHRYNAIRHKMRGGTVRDQFLGDPDKTAALARVSLGVVNQLNRVSAHRWFMEKTLGIHRDKQLPDFADKTFEQWAGETGRVASRPGAKTETVLFQTCFVQHNEPQIGKDAIDVLERNGVKTDCARGLVCCGMPMWEHGDLEGLRRNLRTNLDVLSPFVEAGARVLTINPTCGMMLRREYPELAATEDRPRALALAAAVADPCEYLWSIRKEPRFSRDFQSTPGTRVGYHAPCHLRAQAIGFKGRDLVRLIPGVQAVSVVECCGHDGTFAMKVEGFEASKRIGEKSFDGMKSAQADVWVTECPLAAVQFEQHAGKKPLHPLSVLARAYRSDGFPTALEAPEATKKTGES